MIASEKLHQYLSDYNRCLLKKHIYNIVIKFEQIRFEENPLYPFKHIQNNLNKRMIRIKIGKIMVNGPGIQVKLT